MLKNKSKCIGEKGEFHWQIFSLYLRKLRFTTEWKNLRIEISIIFALYSPGLVLFSLNSLCATCSLPVFVFSSLPLVHLSYLCILPTGDELLGMDGARYLKLDDFKDQDDDFLSPKKTLRDFEGGMGTT